MWAPHRAFRPPKCGECDEVGVGGERASGVAVGPRAPVPSWTGTIPGWALWEEDGGQESWVSAVPSSGFCPSVRHSQRAQLGRAEPQLQPQLQRLGSVYEGGRAGRAPWGLPSTQGLAGRSPMCTLVWCGKGTRPKATARAGPTQENATPTVRLGSLVGTPALWSKHSPSRPLGRGRRTQGEGVHSSSLS